MDSAWSPRPPSGVFDSLFAAPPAADAQIVFAPPSEARKRSRGGPAPAGGDNGATAAPSAPPTSAEAAALRGEVAALKRLLADAGAADPSPRALVALLVAGEPAALYLCKSLQAKAALLDEAQRSCSREAVVGVCDFLVVALAGRHFLELMRRRPGCVRQYLRHLEQTRQTPRLLRLLADLGWVLQEGMARWRHAAEVPLRVRLVALLDVVAFFAQHEELEWQRRAVADSAALLERQLSIENFDSQAAAKAKETDIWGIAPRFCIVRAPMGTFIEYLLFYHPHVTDSKKLSSPEGNRAMFDVDQRRYLWAKLISGARVQDWDMLLEMQTRKGFIFKSKAEAEVIGQSVFAEILYLHDAPLELVVNCVTAIEADDERFVACLSFCLFDQAVAAAVKARNPLMMSDIRSRVVATLGAEASMPLRTEIDDLLGSGKVKWRKNVAIGVYS